MAIVKGELIKKINGTLVQLYPTTSADNVVYDSNNTVADKLNTIETTLTAHAVTNKGSAFSNGLYKITTNSEGHVTAATAVTKSDITELGIPAQDTNTDTKVTSAANHYTPTEDSSSKLSADASSSTAATWNSTSLVTGVDIKRDAKGHVVGVAVDSIKMPDNPNTDNVVVQTATTTSEDYEVLFSATADNTTRTEGARKNSNLKFNPSTGNLQVTKINGVEVGSAEAEIVAARGNFATLAAAIEACVKGMNVFLDAENFAALFGDAGSGEGLYAAGNFNNVGNNKIYPINLSNGNELGNSPGSSINGLLITFGKTPERNNGDTQMIVTAGQAIHTRTYWLGEWTDWNRQVTVGTLAEFKSYVMGE